ncbi:ferritin [Sphingobacterium sp. DK4209]|uniref:Ferritin n=1 Tax=Sphingobacterium zhuxiongii TaxID=2662364 RepID=A0A5Q0Q7T2_9SPHI|nr:MULTISPECIES: ferritin [unclassified Sphingobacterium]MVZ66655.1 ferritin [Sphingobacterium sp. DK4209]QGA25426.1 ferritin [Sphingobacterium sp. dk4302]
MDTNRLSKAMETSLIKQMTKENQASQTYLALGIWADTKGYGGIGNFLFRHAQEERNHMIKIMMYILERGGEPKVEAVEAPKKLPKNITECFNMVFEHEVDNTNAIYNLVNQSMEEKDWATWNFAQWFVKEQIEEEKLAMQLIDKLKIAGGDRATDESLFELDKYLENASDEVTLARESTADKPE